MIIENHENISELKTLFDHISALQIERVIYVDK